LVQTGTKIKLKNSMSTLRHVGLIVSDIDKALSIYRDILGFNPKIDQIESGEFYEHLTGITSGKARTLKCYSSDGTCIELIQYLSHKPEKRNKDLLTDGFNHIALNVSNIDLIYKSLLDLGLESINEPKINKEKSAKVAFCYDYEKNLLELVQTKKL
jgi:glyoxylase I family protein